jgi:sec-independent protein translocase protein TatB
MFDIGFSEVLLIFVIALVVLGPEKLPRAASQVGRWVGRARAMARQFKEQLEEEVNLENVRKAHKEAAAKEEATAKDKDAAGGAAAGVDATGSAATTASGGQPGAQPQPGLHPQMESITPTTIPPEAYTGPDPTEFRADTFSHAHAIGEYGVNPLAPHEGPEELKPPVAAREAAAPSAPESRPTPVDPSEYFAHRASGNGDHASGTHAAAPSSGTPHVEPSNTPPPENETEREPLAVTTTQSDNHGHS